MDPGITVIMLAKNEEERMRRCLASLHGHVAAIVALVDPLSTDGTAQVVRKHGGLVLEPEWPGGFDAARNICLEHVKTEWVLWLDADEWFEGGGAARLRELTKQRDAFCFGLIRQEVFGGGPQARSQVVRLWRSRPYVPFIGLVHEHLDTESLDQAESPGKEYGTDVVINHDGYTPDVMAGKAARYVKLLEEELRRRPGQLFYQVKLACTLDLAQDPRAPAALRELGDELLVLGDELDEAPIPAAEAFGPVLNAVPESDWHSARTDGLLRLGRAWFPDNPSVLWHVSQLEIRRGNMQAALRCLCDLEALAVSGRYDQRTPHYETMVGKGLYTNLALVAHQLGRSDIARRNYERLLEIEPDNAVARQNIQLLQPR